MGNGYFAILWKHLAQVTGGVRKRANIMKKKMSNFAFKMMAHIGMPIRNFFMPPAKMLSDKNQEEVLIELHRVLKSDATLCFSDHHMKEIEILRRLTEKGLFKLLRKGRRTFVFSKLYPVVA